MYDAYVCVCVCVCVYTMCAHVMIWMYLSLNVKNVLPSR